MAECQGWDDNRCCREQPCGVACSCTHDPSTCPHQTLRRDKASMLWFLEREARDESRALDDSSLGIYLTHQRRVILNAAEDGLPDWLVGLTHIRLRAAQGEWDWRGRAEKRGGPQMARENFRERLDELKRKANLVGIVSYYTTLRPAGRELKGLCPFHNEKTPSFYVQPDEQLFHCHGCKVGGDVITFVEMAEAGTFGEAVKVLEGSR